MERKERKRKQEGLRWGSRILGKFYPPLLQSSPRWHLPMTQVSLCPTEGTVGHSGLRDPCVPSNGKENIPLFSNVLSRLKTTWFYWGYHFKQFTQGTGYARDQLSVLWNPVKATSPVATVGDVMKHIFPWLRKSALAFSSMLTCLLSLTLDLASPPKVCPRHECLLLSLLLPSESFRLFTQPVFCVFSILRRREAFTVRLFSFIAGASKC